MPRQYPPEFRERIVALARAGRSASGLSADYDVAVATIYRWLAQDRITTARSPAPPAPRTPSSPLQGSGSASLSMNWNWSARRPRSSTSRRRSAQKALPGDREPDRAGIQRARGVPRGRRQPQQLYLLAQAAAEPARAEASMARAVGGKDPHRVVQNLRLRQSDSGAAAWPRCNRQPQARLLDHARAGTERLAKAAGRKARACRSVRGGRPRSPRLLRGRPEQALGDRHNRAPDQGGQGLLLRRARCLQPQGRRLVDRLDTDGRPGDQRARDGDQRPRTPIAP